MEDEKFSRYERLKTIIKEVEDSGFSNRSTKWYDEHYSILEEYRLNFVDFSYVDIQISNKEFRDKASLVENILRLLMNDYHKYRWFGLYDYVRLNQGLIWLAEYVLDLDKKEETNLSSLFENLKV
jgi:hypothetical protein